MMPHEMLVTQPLTQWNVRQLLVKEHVQVCMGPLLQPAVGRTW